ncbi:MAG: GNAT family N-acetyltransferase [Rhodospirillales bacterium]|nr:GNAT family N-acetyltransferase [Rhodospirillales bacterium]
MINFKIDLENDKIALIQTKISHFDEIYLVASNRVIWEQHPEKDRWRRNKFEKFFKAGIENNLGCFSIYDKNLNKKIGLTRFYSYNEDDNAVRIGYTFIDPEYWGTGCNKQIKKLMLDYAFKYIDKVYFDIGFNNFRSRRAVEKLGAILSSEISDGMVEYLLNRSSFGI